MSPPVFTVLYTEVGQDMMFTMTHMTNTDTKSISKDRTPTNQTKSNKRRQTGIERQNGIKDRQTKTDIILALTYPFPL